jgi:hypothetical protein
MRGAPVCRRKLTAEEHLAVEALARSRTAAARRVERARASGVFAEKRGGSRRFTPRRPRAA